MCAYKFAIIENINGYVFAVIDAESPLKACEELYADAGVPLGSEKLEAVEENEMSNFHIVFDVRIAPENFEILDGKNSATITEVEAMPRVGLFSSTRKKVNK